MGEPLKQLEEQLNEFVDELMAALPRGNFQREAIASMWASEIRAGSKSAEDGPPYAPDQYTLSMHPKDYDALTKLDTTPQTRLTEALRSSLTASQYRLSRDPHITLATDPTLNRSQIRVIAWRSSDPAQEAPGAAQAESPPQGAFFMIEGSQHFPLDRTPINIGRRLDNDLVLEDPHVSRRHAQLRARGGRFVLYDLNSTASTRINGRPIQECVLQPGDVVTLATVQLIYNEDVEGPPDLTPPYKPPFKPEADRDKVTPTDLSRFEVGEPDEGTHELGEDPSTA